MTEPVFDFHAGSGPLLVSVPHDGRLLAPGMAERMTGAGVSLPDTDWHVARLYDFVRELGASLLVARFSRYVVDLNRPADDAALYPGQLSTGLCPRKTFAGEQIYRDEADPAPAEIDARRVAYWQPYHDRITETLAAIRDRHGHALLWDAHSIESVVPRLFDGELAVLNLGSNSGASAGEAIVSRVAAATDDVVLDGRFRGGHITRHYGRPASGVHALQLEIAQRAYMDEASREYDTRRAEVLQGRIGAMLEAFIAAAAGR